MQNKLSKEQIDNNKEMFISLLRNIKRDNANIEGLINYLNDKTDFFYAPSTTQYSLSCDGGLCQHSLNVFYKLKQLIECQGLIEEIPYESVLICGLLHDLYKVNLYKKDFRNKKVYSDLGTKVDNGGRYDWVVEDIYTYTQTPFIYGNNEQNSEYLCRCFIPLSLVESVSILHFKGGNGFDSTKENIPSIYKEYPLALMLHLADSLATYIDDNYDSEISS